MCALAQRKGISRKDDGAMSLFARLLQAVRSWRRRRGGHKTVRFAGVAMEQLDHRQLLSVNFTGNVPTDFPATKVPGVVTLTPDFTNPLTSEPTFANDPQGQALQNLIKVSGFAIQDIRVTYTPYDDTLSFGINQPQSQNHAGEVIASDSDNNGNWGTVNPAVTAVAPLFSDPPDWGGTKSMGVFLNFSTPGATAQIAAGFSADPPVGTAAKAYEVYIPIVSRDLRRPSVRRARYSPSSPAMFTPRTVLPIPTSSSPSTTSRNSTSRRPAMH